MNEHLKRITVAKYMEMGTDTRATLRKWTLSLNGVCHEVSHVRRVYDTQECRMVYRVWFSGDIVPLWQTVNADFTLYIECSAEEALADERQRIGRRLAYWRQLRLSATRQQERGLVPVVSWQEAYFETLWWEDALRRLEAEYADTE